MKSIDKIIYLVSWIANVPVKEILPSTHIQEDLNVDSIDFMLLTIQIEKLFKVDFSHEDVEKIETIQDANNLILRQLELSPA